MITKIIVVAVLILANFPKDFAYDLNDGFGLPKALVPFLHWANFFDAPVKVLESETAPTKNMRPTLERIKYFNYYCGAMYCHDQLNDLSCVICDKFKSQVVDHKVFRNNSMDCTTLVTLSNMNKEIVVAYRGTDDIAKIASDLLSITTSKDKNIKIHSRFYLSMKSTYEPVTNYVKELLTKNKKYFKKNVKIVITGHSLGAAMARALLFVWSDRKVFPNVIYELYTYGEPRVGNAAFANFFNKLPITSARTVHRADIVPHVPFPWYLRLDSADYFVHPQLEFWIHGNHGVFCDSSFLEDPKCSNSLGPIYSLVDHALYFDVNHFICSFNNSHQTMTLPFLQTVRIFPSLPELFQMFMNIFIKKPIE